MENPEDNKPSQSNIVASDLPRGVALLGDFTANLNSILGAATAFKNRVENGEFDTSKGLSLLELKNQAFLSYLTNLSYTFLRKLSGGKLEEDPSIDRLVELRVVLERLRPLEEKLKYRIDKYVKVANEGALAANDPLRSQGNLDNIGSSDEEEEIKVKKAGKVEDEEESEENEPEESSKKYKVPKIAPVRFGEEDEERAQIERARRRARQSAVVRDALYEFMEEPEVVYDVDTRRQKGLKKRKELDRYEEDNFLRKTLSKKEQREMNQITTFSSFKKEILSLGNVDALQDDFGASGPPVKKQKTNKSGKSKKTGKGKKGKKGFKKKRK